MMKKLKKIFVLLFLAIAISSPKIFALTNTDLISIDVNGSEFVVSYGDKIEKVIAKLGAPKIKTDSAFGGYAYTFYDENYKNYLYIETEYDGSIVSYGSVGCNFKTNTYSYMSPSNPRDVNLLTGCMLTGNGIVYGGVFYNKPMYLNNATELISTFVNNYDDDERVTNYLSGIVKHSVAMYNAALVCLGNTQTELLYDEDFFYINEQYKELGTSLREYLNKHKKYSYFKSIGINQNVDVNTSNIFLLNPMLFASFAYSNRATTYSTPMIAVFDYYKDKKLITALAVNPAVFDIQDEVNLTKEEQAKLTAGRGKYKEAIKYLTMDSEVYDVEPQSKYAASLVAGKLKDSKIKGITEYVNSIRAGAGVPEVKTNSDSCTVAQYISTLTSYRVNELGLELMHQPSKPENVSDAFYNVAIGNGITYSENLGLAPIVPNYQTMMQSINMFLSDTSERPMSFGHRLKILDPTYTKFGYGIADNIFSNEFSGVRSTDAIVNAWPTEGVTFIESLDIRRFAWTVKFLNKYQVTAESTVDVECLNTGSKWNFATEENTTDRFFRRDIIGANMLNNKLVFYDGSIYPEAGMVYEITVHNLKNISTNLDEDYTYRVVFEFADERNYPSIANSIKIKTDTKYLYDNEAKEGTYKIPIGQEVNLDIDLDSSVADTKMTWHSSNEHFSIKQNGVVYIEEGTSVDEEAIISVGIDGTNITDQIVIVPYVKLNEIEIDPETLFLRTLKDGENDENELNYGEATVTYIPATTTEDTQITWKIRSKKNRNLEYDIYDENIRRYIQVDTTSEDKKSISVKVNQRPPKGDYEYEIVSYVDGYSGQYTGVCNVDITVPLETITIDVDSNKGTNGVTTYKKTSTGTIFTIEDFDTFYELNPGEVPLIKLKATCIPDETTVDKNVTWIIEQDSDVLELYNNNGYFKINQSGTSTVIARNEKTGIEAKAFITVKSQLNRIVLKSNSQVIKLNRNTTDYYYATDQLEVVRYPAIDNSTITFSSSDESIAKVDSKGKVTFKDNPGFVTIKAISGNIWTMYTYESIIPMNKMYFYDDEYVLRIGDTVNSKIDLITQPSSQSVSDNVVFYSDNNSVARVNSTTGVITAVGVGETTIRAKLSSDYVDDNIGKELTAAVKVIVINPVISVDVSPNIVEAIIEKDKNVQLYLTTSPSNASDNVSVSWRSSNTDIATVNSNGLVTFNNSVIAHNQSVTITATLVAENPLGRTTFKRNINIYFKSLNAPKYERGDLDKNGVVNANDASIALDLYKNDNVTSEDIEIGDMDENGIINANDAALILDIYKKSN